MIIKHVKKNLTVEGAVMYLETVLGSDLSDLDLCELPPDEPCN